VAERDRLLAKLRTQTQRLADQSSTRVPKLVKETVDNLNKVIERLTAKGRPKSRRASTRKKAARRRVKKASA